MKTQVMIETTNVPIRFYGRVVDQYAKPVPDVNIEADVDYLEISPGFARRKTETTTTDRKWILRNSKPRSRVVFTADSETRL